MPIPDFQSIMLPLLKLASDGKEHSFGQAVEQLAGEFGLTPDERSQLLPSGGQALFRNRAGWARFHLVKAGLLHSPRRGIFAITDEGRRMLASKPPKVSLSLLMTIPVFRQFRTSVGGHDARPDGHISGVKDEIETPEEAMDRAYQTRRDALVAELLEAIKAASAAFFESLVVRVLVAMGYGGSIQGAASVVGRSGDEGIDGIIKEDKLGLDVIYVQAKKWDANVGRPAIQQFAGALHGQRAKKGVFITTSTFSKDARDYVAHIDPRIVLVDGKEFAALMIDNDVGVTSERVYELKRMDSDFFVEE